MSLLEVVSILKRQDWNKRERIRASIKDLGLNLPVG